jgi:hypothetical protein
LKRLFSRRTNNSRVTPIVDPAAVLSAVHNTPNINNDVTNIEDHNTTLTGEM